MIFLWWCPFKTGKGNLLTRQFFLSVPLMPISICLSCH